MTLHKGMDDPSNPYAEFTDAADYKVYNPYGWRFVLANTCFILGVVCFFIDLLIFHSPEQLLWLLGAVTIYLFLGVWEAVARERRKRGLSRGE